MIAGPTASSNKATHDLSDLDVQKSVYVTYQGLAVSTTLSRLLSVLHYNFVLKIKVFNRTLKQLFLINYLLL